MTNLSQDTDQLERRVAELERRVAELEQDHKRNDILITLVSDALLFMLVIMFGMKCDIKASRDFGNYLQSKVRLFEGRINALEYSEIDFRRELATCKI